MSGEKRLVNKMLSNYQRVGKVGRPVLNISTTIVVHFGLGLIQLALDEKDNFLTLSMWTKYVSDKLNAFSAVTVFIR